MPADDSFLDWETRDEAIPLHKHLIAGRIKTFLILIVGSCAGIMEHVGMFPLDTVKVGLSLSFLIFSIDTFASKWKESYFHEDRKDLI